MTGPKIVKKEYKAQKYLRKQSKLEHEKKKRGQEQWTRDL